ncbi:hypothetical protein [Hymenobacter sp.]|uniref:hypothetical protein n=1 Tax=Hymenobacter sp. TaxID=1898978 RepID=UPI00286C539C|nr:hypothetical protein [Hymenobacter sp.]
MINQHTDPAAWALLMYELEDAEDGLKSLFKDIAEDPEFGEVEFRIHMAHIYVHLNRAWNSRNATAEQQSDDVLWKKWGRFPVDIEPL